MTIENIALDDPKLKLYDLMNCVGIIPTIFVTPFINLKQLIKFGNLIKFQICTFPLIILSFVNSTTNYSFVHFVLAPFWHHIGTNLFAEV